MRKTLSFSIAFLYVLLSYHPLAAQDENSYPILSYWDMEDVFFYEYEFYHRQKEEVDSLKCNLYLRVIDSTAEEYTIQAKYFLSNDQEAMDTTHTLAEFYYVINTNGEFMHMLDSGSNSTQVLELLMGLNKVLREGDSATRNFKILALQNHINARYLMPLEELHTFFGQTYQEGLSQPERISNPVNLKGIKHDLIMTSLLSTTADEEEDLVYFELNISPDKESMLEMLDKINHTFQLTSQEISQELGDLSTKVVFSAAMNYQWGFVTEQQYVARSSYENNSSSIEYTRYLRLCKIENWKKDR